MITEEIRYFTGILENSSQNCKNPPEDSVQTIYTLEKQFESAENNGMLIETEKKYE